MKGETYKSMLPAYSPIGIDMGSRTINVVQLKKTRNNLSVYRMLSFPYSGGNDKKNLENMQQAFNEVGFKGSETVSRMPPQQVVITPIKITKKKNISLDKAIIDEARNVIPFPINESIIDYLDISLNDVKLIDEGGNEEKKILLVMAKSSDVDDHIKLLESLKLKPIAVDIGPNALKRSVNQINPSSDKHLLLINIGDEFTYFTIIWDNKILIDRKINWGEVNLVNKLKSCLDLGADEIRKVLRGFGVYSTSSENNIIQNECINDADIPGLINDMIYEDLNFFISETEKLLVYCASEMRGGSIDHAYLMGCGALIKNFNDFLEIKTGVKVKYYNPLEKISLYDNKKTNDRNISSIYGVAIGLALRGFA